MRSAHRSIHCEQARPSDPAFRIPPFGSHPSDPPRAASCTLTTWYHRITLAVGSSLQTSHSPALLLTGTAKLRPYRRSLRRRSRRSELCACLAHTMYMHASLVHAYLAGSVLGAAPSLWKRLGVS